MVSGRCSQDNPSIQSCFEVRILHATTTSSWPSTKRPRPVAGDHTHGMKHTQHIQSKIRLGLLLNPGIQGSIKSLDFIIIIISIQLYINLIYNINIYIYYTYIWFHWRKCTFPRLAERHEEIPDPNVLRTSVGHVGHLWLGQPSALQASDPAGQGLQPVDEKGVLLVECW